MRNGLLPVAVAGLVEHRRRLFWQLALDRASARACAELQREVRLTWPDALAWVMDSDARSVYEAVLAASDDEVHQLLAPLRATEDADLTPLAKALAAAIARHDAPPEVNVAALHEKLGEMVPADGDDRPAPGKLYYRLADSYTGELRDGDQYLAPCTADDPLGQRGGFRYCGVDLPAAMAGWPAEELDVAVAAQREANLSMEPCWLIRDGSRGLSYSRRPPTGPFPSGRVYLHCLNPQPIA